MARTVLLLAVAFGPALGERLTSKLGKFQSDDSDAGFANLKINRLDKVKVEAISRAEALRLRQSGLRFHEVEHHHFGDGSSNGKVLQDLKEAAASADPLKGKKLEEPAKPKELTRFQALKKRISFSKETRAVPPKGKDSSVPTTKQDEKIQEEEEDSNSSSLDTSLKEALTPTRKIRPTRVAGFLCAQFDLDLFALSGGTFPGLAGIGLLGDIHYTPSTKCFGWTAELYLMLSIGIGLFGMDFRVSLVVIATLVVTERPLAAGNRDLVWELPPGYDTEHCTQSNPFKLIHATTKEGWKFVYNHILRKKYLKHAELEVQKYLQENKHETAEFHRYVNFIEPPQALPAQIDSASQSRGLARQGIVGSVTIQGKWLEDSIELEVILPKEQRVRRGGISFDLWYFVKEIRARIWQELSKAQQVILSQESEPCRWPRENGSRCTFRFPARRESTAFFQLFMKTYQVFVVPIMVDTGSDEFRFPASVRAEVPPPAGTLSCQKLLVKPHGDMCPEVTSVELKVEVGSIVEQAKWSWEQLGEGSPWGISVPKESGAADHAEIDEALAGKSSVSIRLYELSNRVLLQLLKDVRTARPGWCPPEEDFRQALWRKLSTPTRAAAEVLETQALVELLTALLQHFRAQLRKQMEARQEEVLVIADLSKGLEVREDVLAFLGQLAKRFDDSVKECAALAIQDSMQHHSKGQLLRNYKRCTRGDESSKQMLMFKQLRLTIDSHKTWTTFEQRTVNTGSCNSPGLVSAENLEMCKEACEMESEGLCNTVVFESQGEEAGFCSLWHCNSWDVFPKNEHAVLAVKLPKEHVPNDLELFLSSSTKDIKDSLKAFSRSSLEDAVETLLVDSSSIAVWNDEMQKLWPDRDKLSGSFVLEGLFHPLVAGCLLKEGSWISPHKATALLRGSSNADDGVQVKLVYKHKEIKGRWQLSELRFFAFNNDFKGSGNRWIEHFTIQPELSESCTMKMESHWVWQVPGQTAYFVRPNVVPVAQALFAGYDQFVSKLPAYGKQAIQRLLPKNDSSWKMSMLPYKTTDGRHLHRHIKSGQQDKVKVYKGDLSTDDAVYNFPKALKESKMRDDPTFLYNAGLSVANLFLRILSDVQALFNLYFANHPDWDQTCESLPARFSLLFEMEDTRPTSNWKSSKFLRNFGASRATREKRTLKLTHRAGDTVSQRGREMTDDDRAMIMEWHWVSKPTWLSKRETRAAFFKPTPPVHGKDGWATTDVSQLSSVMWPHMWCELVEQEWQIQSMKLPSQDEGHQTLMLNLKDLYSQIPDSVLPLIKDRQFDTYARDIIKMLPDFPSSGCPDRMTNKHKNAVDLATFALLSAWDTSISALKNSLNFFQVLAEALLKEEDDLTEGAETETEQPEETVSRSAQLDTIMNTIKVSLDKWRIEGIRGQGLRKNLMLSWEGFFKELSDSETQGLVEARRSFQESREALEALLVSEKKRTREVGDHLERLFSESGASSSQQEDKAAQRALHPLHVALRYVSLLTDAALARQQEVLSHFRRISSCIDAISKPKALPGTAFGEWTKDPNNVGKSYRPYANMEGLARMRKWFKIDESAQHGADLFFDEACRVPPHTDFTTPEHERLDKLGEPRSECERVILSNAFITIFPNFAVTAMLDFERFRNHLKVLGKNPTKEKVDDMLRQLFSFVTRLKTAGSQFRMDDDFYKSFAYREDGSLIGHLWANLPSALTEIAATLQTRENRRTQWITESIAFRAKLKSARRMRLREMELAQKTIATKVEGCVCQERWSGYVWSNYLPGLKSFQGCVSNTKAMSLKFVHNSQGWKGFCKTKKDKSAVTGTSCKVKFAECDPEATSTKPKFQIWRSADVLRADPVHLPLLQLDLYLHIDLRNRRADFCTPNFAAIMFDTNWHWSMSNWLPYDLRRSGCFGARIHPPGVSLQLTVCRHSALGGLQKEHKTTELSLTGVAYLLSHYNVWGTGDGDMTHNWFGGGENWGAKAAGIGFPNFIMADPGTWASAAGGSGYLSTSSVAASPSAFWFALLAEMMSALSLLEFTSGENRTKFETLKIAATGGVTVLWRLLQKYAVVPNNWPATVASRAVVKHMKKMGIKMVSPFRNEHDVVLSIKYSRQWAKRKLSLPSLINDMSMEQLHQVFLEGRRLGAPVDELWKQYTSTQAGSPTVVRNIHRETLEDMFRSYTHIVKTSSPHSFLRPEQSSQQLMQKLFRQCDGRPLWYKVVGETAIYTFWKRESSAWVQPKLRAGEVLMISKYDKEWYSVHCKHAGGPAAGRRCD